jgi:GntR family transcriptional repressor for pyruvate dehydrogenase complex
MGDESDRRRRNWHFHPISGTRAHEEVVDQITFAIRSGIFGPGDKLPYVDDLARAMKVSKPTIGEAIKVLGKAGVVAAQRGINGGLVVMTDKIPDAVTGLASGWSDATLVDLVEARRPIEIRLALLAAERGGEEDFATMEYSIERLAGVPNKDRFGRIHYDHLFHYSMGRAARSKLLANYQHQLLEQLFLKMRLYFEVSEKVEDVVALHRMTLAALRTRRPAVIERAIDEHLQPLERQVAAAGDGAKRLRGRARAVAS